MLIDECGDDFRAFRPPFKEFKTALRAPKVVPQGSKTGLVGRVQRLKPADLHLQLHLLLGKRITGEGRHHIFKGCLRRVEGVFKSPGSHIAAKKLVDELLLADKLLERYRVQRVLGPVGQHLDLGEHVARSPDAPVALLKVHGARRRIKMVRREQTLLHVHADAEFFRCPHEHANVTTVHGVEQAFPRLVRLEVVDDGYVFFGNASGDQLVPDVLEQVELAVSALEVVAEHDLRRLAVAVVFPTIIDVFHGSVGLAGRLVRQGRIDEPQVDGRLFRLAVDLQRHAAIFRIGLLLTRQPVPLGALLPQRFNVIGQRLRTLHGHLVNPPFLQLGKPLDVVEVFRQSHIRAGTPEREQLRAVHKLVEAFHLVELAGRRFLQIDAGVGKGTGKVVELFHPELLQKIGARVAEHGPHFRQGIRDRRTRGEHHVLAAGLRLHMPGLHEHLHGTLRRITVEPLHVVHLGVEASALVDVGLVDDQRVHAELFEIDVLVLLRVRQRLKTILQLLNLLADLFDRPALR